MMTYGRVAVFGSGLRSISGCSLHARGRIVRLCSKRAMPVQAAAHQGTYKRLVAEKPGTNFRSVAKLIEEQIPTPGPEQVLVRVDYAGINGGHETFSARADFAFSARKQTPNYPLGAEGCGTVVAVGPGVPDLQAGQAVAINLTHCFAEYVLVSQRSLIPVAEPCPEVVALTLSGTTACASLEHTAHIKAGDVVLVTAAAGGTGHFAVQLAKLAGCTVIATCSSQQKAEMLKELGADRVVVYTEESLADVLKSEFPTGVDVVYECVGGSLLQTALDNLAPGGRLLQVGYISQYPHSGTSPGSLPSLSVGGTDLPSVEQCFWGGKNIELDEGRRIIGSIWPKDRKLILASRQRVFDLWQSGHLRAVVDQSHNVHGVGRIPDAVEYMLKGLNVGKVVIKLP